MEVDHLVAKSQQQPDDFDATARVVHVVAVESPVLGEVDDCARNTASSQKIAQRHEVGLHPSPWRRIRTKQENPEPSVRWSGSHPWLSTGGPNARVRSANCYAPLTSRLTRVRATGDGQ